MEILHGLRAFVFAHPAGVIALAIVALIGFRYGGRAFRWMRDDLASLIKEDDAARFEIDLRDDDPEIVLADEIATDLGKLIEAGRWDLFHSLLAEWERDRATTPFGTMFHRLGVERALWPFERIEAAVAESEDPPDDAQIDAIVAAFEARATAQPEDHVAATLAARAHMAAGGIARGDGFLEEVSASNLRRMSEHYRAAEALLSRHVSKRSSLVAEARYLVCLGLETGSALLRERFEEWLAVDPDDVAPWQVHGFQLLPRWFGDIEELETTARRAAEASAPRRGAAGYVIFHGGIISCGVQTETMGVIDPALFVRSALDRARTAGSQWGVNRMAQFLMQAMLESRGAARDVYRDGLVRLVHDHLRVLVPRAWTYPIEDVRRELARLFKAELAGGGRVRVGTRGVEVLPPEPEATVTA